MQFKLHYWGVMDVSLSNTCYEWTVTHVHKIVYNTFQQAEETLVYQGKYGETSTHEDGTRWGGIMPAVDVNNFMLLMCWDTIDFSETYVLVGWWKHKLYRKCWCRDFSDSSHL